MKFEIIDCKPVPADLAAEVREIKRLSGANLNSCDRTVEAVRYARSQGCKLSSQQELWDGFRAGRPGFNPANPPGRSTHERRNDGVAYRGPAGMPLRYWQVGMDWSNAPGVVRAAASLGFLATVTYPSSPREGQHVNFRKEPKIKVPFRVLKRGSTGSRVEKITRRLMVARDPDTGEPYLTEPSRTFTERVEKAVRSFQFDHHQKVDGIVGKQTWTQIEVSHRFWYRRNEEQKNNG